jgi:predicted Zn-dependent protease with MMP-like domain
LRVTREAFEQLVASALNELPPDFAEKLENVEVVVAESPAPADLDEGDLPDRGLILGLYHGVPLTRRSVWGGWPFPDRITIYQRAVERVSRTPREMIENVRRTVLHEIAHHFGISDEKLAEMGLD